MFLYSPKTIKERNIFPFKQSRCDAPITFYGCKQELLQQSPPQELIKFLCHWKLILLRYDYVILTQ
ncbi:CLUMA_CG001462, isoform A [Clunio marinus]|uniref:CLUMA_CG001462, isoform A n=1 Tax=Clunio marinus TaxID=568069 RepID=A0A1J1HI30_9DIPT|nr:CLUMA_CG001462, isoform A [Clunio marinus]